MKDVKSTVSRNLAALRKNNMLTQAQLAEKFNYSDKAICRWESGETLPDINVLASLCDFYGITMNDLIDPDFAPDGEKKDKKYFLKYRLWSCLLLATSVWILAAVVFAFSSGSYWLAFLCAVPVTCLFIHGALCDIMGTVGKIIVDSLLAWSIITTVYLHCLLYADANVWYLFLVGLPLEGFIIQFFAVKRYKEKI